MVGARPFEGRVVFVIEDHDDTRDAMVRLLSALGARVVAAGDGLDGLQQVARWHPDVVFCDIAMPLMDGLEFARRLRQSPRARQTLLIAVTGQSRSTDVLDSWLGGFDGHLVKPVTADQLAAIAQRLPGSTDVLGTA